MPVTRLESLVKANGVGLSGVQVSIRKNRSTFRKLLSLFNSHFTVRNGIVKTAMATPAPAAAETPQERRARMDNHSRRLSGFVKSRTGAGRRRDKLRGTGCGTCGESMAIDVLKKRYNENINWQEHLKDAQRSTRLKKRRTSEGERRRSRSPCGGSWESKLCKNLPDA